MAKSVYRSSSLLTYEDGDKVLVDSVTFASPAAEAGLEFDQQILKVRAPTQRMTKELMWIPGFLLFALVVWLQRRRRSALGTAHARDALIYKGSLGCLCSFSRLFYKA